MAYWILSTVAVVVAVIVILATGWWRRAFIVFAIRPARMTVEGLGLHVTWVENIERVNGILRNFIGGFNAMITKPTEAACDRHCEAVASIFRPFAEEGVAMGYTLRRLFRYQPEDFERRLVRPRPEYRYLYYVGLGFWSGMRRHSAGRMARIVDGLDRLHRYLCYDGYGFSCAFFDLPKDAKAMRRLDTFEGYARNAAYQGVGRALWFQEMDRPEVLIERMRALGEFAVDAAAGVGLASVFVNPDRLEEAQKLASMMPEAWQEHFHLGMCFALKARSINDLDRFEQDMARLEPAVRDAALAAVRECDRIELNVRAERPDDGYQRWRRLVTDWMTENVNYPLMGLRPSAERALKHLAASR